MVKAGETPRQAVREISARLAAAGCPDAGFDAGELVRLATGRDPLLSEALLTGAEAAALEALCLRREAREPLQYLCGRWPFLNFELEVGPGALCPRADTEVVAEAAAGLLEGAGAPRVLDLCAGTGCLGLGVRMFCPSARVTCLEKSPEAFRYLIRNAEHALAGRGIPAPAVEAVQGDLFDYWQTLGEGTLDLIVSNPPYLTAGEMAHLQPETAREPAMALAAGEDGLAFYRAIAEHYLHTLRPGGALALEIGWQQRQAVEQLLRDAGWAEIACRKDYGGNDRCVTARRPKISESNNFLL